MGDSRFARCLQGGGVEVLGGTVSIVNSQIYSNTAGDVRAHLQHFPSPPWEIHDLRVVLQGGGVHAYTGTVSIINSQVYSNQATNVRAHAQKCPSPRWEKF